MFRSSHLPRFVSFVVGVAVLGLAAGAMAQETNWIGAEASNWSDPSNWDNGVPDSTTDATIDVDSGLGIGNPILDTDGFAQNLRVGVYADTHLTVDANTLAVTNDIYLGQATGTTSTITQSGGAISCNMLYAGSTELTTSGVGNYTMTGGTLTVGILSLGNQGSATFTQSGGVVNCWSGIWFADAKIENSNGGLPAIPGGPGSATYTLSNDAVYNGTINSGMSYLAPWGGYGVLNLEDNSVFTNHDMTVDASWSTATSTCIINVHDNAQMTLTGTLTLAAPGLATGTVNQDGGTVAIKTIDKGLGNGTYNLTGGTLSVSKVDRMDLVNNGGRVNAGETGAVSSLTMGWSPAGNIALGKTATQSSYYWEAGWPATNAIDGLFNNMAHTNYDENAWWKVDLTGDNSNTSIHDIVLTARYDGYTWGLSNFWVRVLDKDGVTVAWQGKFIEDASELLGAGEDLVISLPAAVDGRYVQVQLDGWNLGAQVGREAEQGFLTITEAQVGDIQRYGYSQSASSTLGIELDPANELCDRLLAGALTIDGTLEVTALSTDFAAGQVFDILDWSSLTGTFSTVNLPTLSGMLAWDTSNLYVTGALAVVSTSVPVPGDATGNGIVDEEDAKRLAQYWGATTENPELGWWAMGDFTGDNRVDAKDAAVLAANWGYNAGSGESAEVPEPGVIAMLLMAAATLLLPARRGR